MLVVWTIVFDANALHTTGFYLHFRHIYIIIFTVGLCGRASDLLAACEPSAQRLHLDRFVAVRNVEFLAQLTDNFVVGATRWPFGLVAPDIHNSRLVWVL